MYDKILNILLIVIILFGLFSLGFNYSKQVGHKQLQEICESNDRLLVINNMAYNCSPVKVGE